MPNTDSFPIEDISHEVTACNHNTNKGEYHGNYKWNHIYCYSCIRLQGEVASYSRKVYEEVISFILSPNHRYSTRMLTPIGIARKITID